MAAQLAPHLARWRNLVVRLGQGVHAQVGETDALSVKETKDVVVGPHKERNGIGVWFVPGEHRCVDVAMRRDEREASDLLVKRCRDIARRRLGREEAVWVRERLLPADFHHGHRSRSLPARAGPVLEARRLNERAGVGGFSPVAQPLHLMAHYEQEGHHDH